MKQENVEIASREEICGRLFQDEKLHKKIEKMNLKEFTANLYMCMYINNVCKQNISKFKYNLVTKKFTLLQNCEFN